MGEEEKREHKRLPVSFPVLWTVKTPFMVRVRIGDSIHSAVAQDIGEGGMALLTNFEIPVDTLLSLKFTIVNEVILSSQDCMHYFELDAQVCYSARTEGNAYRIGVSFLNILPSGRLFIVNYIRTNALIHDSEFDQIGE
jgi:PilZ domain